MGTNFYLEQGDNEPLHIGKSSMGWCFSLRIYPDDGILDLADWQERWKTGTITNEYGNTLTPDEMTDIITNRESVDWGEPRKIPHGYTSWAQLHRENESREGPRGLLRSTHRVHHYGAGTWDCFDYEFS